MNKRGKLSIVVLGIIAVIAIVGMVILFGKASITGNYVVESGIAQFTPQEACEQLGCLLKGTEGNIHPASTVRTVAICACTGGDIRAPLVRPFSLEEYYNYKG